MNLKDKILSYDDIQSRKIKIEKWGGAEVEVREFDAETRADILLKSADKKGRIDETRLMFDMVLSCTYDPETGERLFTKDDLAAVKKKNGAAVEEIANAALDINGMGGQSIEAREKNS
jgi:methyl coenzyme M reductase gamma subunit